MIDTNGWSRNMGAAPRGTPILICRADDWERSIRVATINGGPPLVSPSCLPADRWREIDGPSEGET